MNRDAKFINFSEEHELDYIEVSHFGIFTF